MGNTGLYVAHNCPGHTGIRMTGIRITGFRITERPLCIGLIFRKLHVLFQRLTVFVDHNSIPWICAIYGNNNMLESIVIVTHIIIIVIIIIENWRKYDPS